MAELSSLLLQSTPLPSALVKMVVLFRRTVSALLVADKDNHVIRAVKLADGSVGTFAGAPGKPTTDCEDTTKAGNATFNQPFSLAFDAASDRLFVGEENGIQVVSTTGPTPTATTLKRRLRYGGFRMSPGEDELILSLALVGPHLYTTDSRTSALHRLGVNGTGFEGFVGDAHTGGFEDGQGEEARFFFPRGLAVDPSNQTLYLVEFGNHSLRKIVCSNAVVSTVVGDGQHGHVDGACKHAKFNFPGDVVCDKTRLVVADCMNQCLREVDLKTNTVRTLAGQPGECGHRDGPGNTALFDCPVGLALDNDSGDVYVSCSNHTIRRVTAEGMVSTVCGVAGEKGFENGKGDEARFSTPMGLALM